MHKCIFFSQIHVLNRGWKKIVLNCFILLHFASRIEYTWAMSNEHWTCTLNKQLLTLQMLTTISIKYICFQQTSHAFTLSKAESKSRISASVCFLILLLLLPWNLCLNRVKHSALGIVFFFSFSKIHWRTKKRILWMLEKWNLWQFSMVFIKQSLTNKSAECIAEIHKRFRMLLHHRNRFHKIICRKKLFDFLPKLKYFAISLYKILFQSWLQILITLK